MAAIAVELQRGAVLDGAAVDTILAVGEPVDVEEGPPTSGAWTPIVMCHIAGVEEPVRLGESYPWHDARVQRASQLFMPADAPPDVIEKAIDDHHESSMSPAPVPTRLKAGPGVVRARRGFIGRTRDGVPLTIGRGELAREGTWMVVRCPNYFEPSVAEGALVGPTA